MSAGVYGAESDPDRGISTQVSYKISSKLPVLSTWHLAPGLYLTKLYCFMTEAHECEQLAQSRYQLAVELASQSISQSIYIAQRHNVSNVL